MCANPFITISKQQKVCIATGHFTDYINPTRIDFVGFAGAKVRHILPACQRC